MNTIYPNGEGVATADVRTRAFDEKYRYDGPLGALYTKEATTFILWAPTADAVVLEVYESYEEHSALKQSVAMERGEQGTWKVSVEGDCHLMAYTYLLDFGQVGTTRSQDPYAIATVVNGDRSVVVNPESVALSDWPRMAPFGNPTDAIIYELNTRDFSITENSGIEHKGKFLGLVEEGTKTPTGQITGLDYLKSLGFTHLQLLPIYDYATIDETEEKPTKYNWGYDPKNYNVPEGSYSTDPYNPVTRILELKQTIKKLQDNGIRVIMDVVYNHVYELHLQAFHKTVPGYYFRYHEDGSRSNGTGVGNDTASERYMMRRYMIDSLTYWIREYRLNGIRFDLMGIHDVETMNLIRAAVDEIDPSVILLGEGWNLNTVLAHEQKAAQHNAYLMPRIAHFNDSIRNKVKGGNFDKTEGGFVNGSPYAAYDVARNLLVGIPNSTYKDPGQVVQYVEAHDDLTLYDKLCHTHPHDSDDTRYKRHLLATTLVLLAQGIPFIHAGQEFLRTKELVENSYNAPDSINKFDWSRAEQYADAIEYVRGVIKFRKATALFRQMNYDQILDSLAVYKLEDGVIAYQLERDQEAYFVAINGNEHPVDLTYLPYGTYQKLIVDQKAPLEKGEVFELDGHYQVPSLSVTVMKKLSI